jgi:ubiquinone/menaquinone biosynthesis C-methylase UbiE
VTDPASRFSGRVEAYLRHRPGYPAELVQELLKITGLGPGAAVADIGSGTGLFTQRLLEQDLDVFAVEPNQPMRAAAEASLGDNPLFTSVDARAEQTGLADGSLDLITAAQSFHWFNNRATRNEFARILKADARIALIWNRRDTQQPLQKAYDAVLQEMAPEYGEVSHMNLGMEQIAGFLELDEIEQLHFAHSQRLDFAGLLGRLKSSSYCPDEHSPHYIPLVTELLALFDHYAVDGHIDFDYDTQVFIGPPIR